MIKKWKERGLARLCSGALSAFRRIPLRMSPDDLRNLRISFSQFGEDLVVWDSLGNSSRQDRGIYVDAGCFDPVHLSNTRLLNLLGWRGINIDASPERVAAFRKARPQDENICAALDQTSGANEFLATIGGATSRLAEGASPLPEGFPVTGRWKVETTTLEHVLANSPFTNEIIDFLDIDCEGSDLRVLKGLNLRVHRPRIICIEAHTNVERLEIEHYLGEASYEFLCTRGPSLLFRDSGFSC